MSERDRLLTTGTRDLPAVNVYHRIVRLEAQASHTITKHWAKAVKVIRGREFFAEFLATFMLIVSQAAQHCTCGAQLYLGRLLRKCMKIILLPNSH